MRKIERAKRRKASVGPGVAVVGAAVFSVATWGNGASANESGAFWPRLGANAVPTSELKENGDFADGADFNGAEVAPRAAEPRNVESANFVGYSANSGFRETRNAVDAQTRLVGWTEPDAAVLNGERPVEASVSNESAEAGGDTAKRDGSAGRREIASRSKTPILRDEPTAATRDDGSLAGALVSTFGALAVVLGAFFALVALLKRTGASGGGGSALEIVDSLPVGDKARLLTIRWGNRLILAAKTPEKIASLAEIADVDEANALLAEIERRKESAASGKVGEKTAALWKRGRDAAKVWRTAVETKGRRR